MDFSFNFKSYDNSKQSISYCEVDKCPAVIKLREQLEAYKMEAEEGKEINAELKAENDELKRLIAKQKNAKIQLSKLKDKQYKEFCDMKQTLIEIKEIASPYNDMSGNCVIVNCFEDMYKILQKISKVMPDEN